MRRIATLSILIILGWATAQAADTLRVVATLSTFGDLVKTIGDGHVSVETIASPKFNPHFIEAKPSDIVKVKHAQLFVHAGLDLEAWRPPLLDAAGNVNIRPGTPGELDLSQGIPLLEVPNHLVSRSEGDIHLFGNPHYWISPENGRRMAKTIGDKLAEVDSAHAADYQKNLADFTAKLDAKMPEWQAKMKPFAGAELVGYHNEWPYLMQFLGLKMDNFLEPKPGIPPTPKQLEFLEGYIKEHNVKAIVQSSYYPTKAADSLAKKTGAKVVTLCQGVGESADSSDYIAMVDYDVNQLADALK